LLRARARWAPPPKVDEAAVERLAKTLCVSPLVARLLVARGMADAASAERFLHGKEDHFHDPFLLDGMEQAAGRIREAIRRGERIRIYGDYDADGVSATSLTIGLMERLGAAYDYVIPNRHTEGYGLNGPAIEKAAKDGVGLIVTVDTGISAVREASLARTLGIDLIVTDHHEPPEVLPDTVATINPRKPGCPYPFKSLAGVGVAFKLAHALLGRLPKEYAWLAAIGTIADLMPLVDENRLIARMGLAQMRESPARGIRALCQVSDIDFGQLSGGHIGFSIGPRLNAGGRLETADAAVRCLTTDDEREASETARELDRLNRERQELVDEIAAEALEQANALLAAGDPGNVLLLAGEGWNTGVVGIVASRVVERHYRPAIVLSIDRETGLAKGSARSIPGFDLHAALTECADLMEQFGGHKAAAGMTLKAENIPRLRRRMNETAAAWLGEDDYVPVLRTDAEIRPADVTVDTVRELEMLAPYGMGNPEPVFLLSGMRLKGARRMGREMQHAKLTLTSADPDAAELDALLFGKGELAERISPTGHVDLAGTLSVNEWNGTRKAQIIVQDLRVPERQMFDWRGRTLADPAVAKWLRSGLVETKEESALCGALLFRGGDICLLPEAENAGANRTAFWLAGEDGCLKPLNERAESMPPRLVTHLMLPVLPPSAASARLALANFPALECLYAVLLDPHPFLSAATADREAFKRVYAVLLQWKRGARAPAAGMTGNTESGESPLSAPSAVARLAKATGLTTDMIRFILAVFEQLGFLAAHGHRLIVAEAPAKKALDESPLYREKASRAETERVFLFSTAAELKRFLLDGETPESAISPANAQEGLS